MNGESIFDVIIQGYSSLTRSETRVADYILKHKPELPYIMSKTLADACQVSEATITRFCRSVGCASFNDFKVRAAQAISSDSTSGPLSNGGVATSFYQTSANHVSLSFCETYST